MRLRPDLDLTFDVAFGPGRTDVVETGDLVTAWPVTERIGPLDAFEDEPAVDTGTGRLGCGSRTRVLSRW